MFNYISKEISLLLIVSVFANFVKINGHFIQRGLKFEDQDNKVSEQLRSQLSEYIMNIADIGQGLKGDPGRLETKFNDFSSRKSGDVLIAQQVPDDSPHADANVTEYLTAYTSLNPYGQQDTPTTTSKPLITTETTTKPSTTSTISSTSSTTSSTTTTTTPHPTTTKVSTTTSAKTPTEAKKNETTSVLPLHTNIVLLNSTNKIKDVTQECSLFKNGSDVDIVKMIDVWRAVYFQSVDEVSCIKIILKGIPVMDQIKYAKEYFYLNDEIQWNKCHLEVKSRTRLRKHFLQGGTGDRGIFQNMILTRNNTASKMNLQSESPDHWRLIDDFLLMRDCDSGEVIVFSRVLKNPTKEELMRVLIMFGEDKMTGKLTCQDEFDDEMPPRTTSTKSPRVTQRSFSAVIQNGPSFKMGDDEDESAAEYEDLES